MSTNFSAQVSPSQPSENVYSPSLDDFKQLISHISFPDNSDLRFNSESFIRAMFNPDIFDDQSGNLKEHSITYTPLPTASVPFLSSSSTAEKVSQFVPQALPLPLVTTSQPSTAISAKMEQFLVCHEKIATISNVREHIPSAIQRHTVQPPLPPLQPLPFDVLKENPFWLVDAPLIIEAPYLSCENPRHVKRSRSYSPEETSPPKKKVNTLGPRQRKRFEQYKHLLTHQETKLSTIEQYKLINRILNQSLAQRTASEPETLQKVVARIEQLKQEELRQIAVLSRLQKEIAVASTTLKNLQKEP
jgi:hypothetical protein